MPVDTSDTDAAAVRDACANDSASCDSAQDACVVDGVVSSGCPRLRGLDTMPSGLMPAFDPEVASYELRVPLTASSILLSPAITAGAVLEIDGESLVSLPYVLALPLGISRHTIEVSHGGNTTTYTLTIARSASVEAYIKAHVPVYMNEFGSRIALDGDRLAVATGNGGAAGPYVPGAVYVFEHDAGVWVQTTHFGFNGSISLDGDVLVVGVPGEGDGSGAVHVYRCIAGEWSEEAHLQASNVDQYHFGLSVSLSGNWIAVGAPRDRDGGSGSDTDDGGSPNSDELHSEGAVYLFEHEGSAWIERAYLKASTPDAHDQFGSSVSLDGNFLAVGAPFEDGDAISPAEDNNVSEGGAVYVFSMHGDVWTQYAYVKPNAIRARDRFGHSVALRGDLLAVGSPRDTPGSIVGSPDSAAYVFRRIGTSFTQEAHLTASEPERGDFFGSAVSIDGNRVVVGAPYGGNLDPLSSYFPRSGIVYTYAHDGSVWVREADLQASNAGAGDLFGTSVAVDGSRIAVGAPAEDGDGSTLESDGVMDTGAVYVFE